HDNSHRLAVQGWRDSLGRRRIVARIHSQNGVQPDSLNGDLERTAQRRVVGHDKTLAPGRVEKEVCGPTGIATEMRQQLVSPEMHRSAISLHVGDGKSVTDSH